MKKLTKEELLKEKKGGGMITILREKALGWF